MLENSRVPRKRIFKGHLVASTNPIQLACIQALHIIHLYTDNYTRVRRYVDKTTVRD